MNASTRLKLVAVLIGAAALAAPALARPDFKLPWYSVASGGVIDATTTPGNHFGLDASVAQIDGRAPGFGAPFTLQPGFWGGDPPCVADLTGDYVVDLSDYFAFFNCFDATAPCADLDDSGEVDLSDFFAFFNAFDKSC